MGVIESVMQLSLKPLFSFQCSCGASEAIDSPWWQGAIADKRGDMIKCVVAGMEMIEAYANVNAVSS